MQPARVIDELPAGMQAAFQAHDAEFGAVLGPNPRLVRVVDTDAHEGPVYVPAEGALYFTTLPRAGSMPAPGFPEVAIKRLALDGDRFPLDPEQISTVQAATRAANGLTLDGEGRLVVCEQGTRAEPARIARFNPATGSMHTIVDAWGGLPLNSPNDVVVKGDGTIWFTDPSYGHLQGFRPEPLVGDYVYRYEPGSGRLSVVADGFDKPNGLGLLAGRVRPVHHRQRCQPGAGQLPRPASPSHQGLRRARRPPPGRGAAVCSDHAGVPGRRQGRRRRPGLRLGVQRRPGVQPRRRPDRPDPSPRRGQLHLRWAARNVLFITTDTAVWAAVLQAAGSATAARPSHQHPKGA